MPGLPLYQKPGVLYPPGAPDALMEFNVGAMGDPSELVCSCTHDTHNRGRAYYCISRGRVEQSLLYFQLSDFMPIVVWLSTVLN